MITVADETQVTPDGPDIALDPRQWLCGEVPFDLAAMGAAILPAAAAAWLLSLDATEQASVYQLARPLPCHVCPLKCESVNVLRWYLGAAGAASLEALGFPPDTNEGDLAFRAAVAKAVVAAVKTRSSISVLGRAPAELVDAAQRARAEATLA